MGRITELLDTAHSRSQTHAWPFVGAFLPHEAHELLQLAPGTRLIDVRSHAELEFNGTIPNAVHVELLSWPGWVLNAHFHTQLAQATDSEGLLLFICRTGIRAHRAASACAESGRGGCYVVLEGFEGDINKATGHRNEINGWKFRGQPWAQA
jgi:rhodanese-related sulfurtransferase